MLASALLDSLPVPAVYPVLVLVFRGAKCYRTTQDKIDRVDGTKFSGVQVVFSPSPRLFAPFGFGRCLHLAGWQLPRFRFGRWWVLQPSSQSICVWVVLLCARGGVARPWSYSVGQIKLGFGFIQKLCCFDMHIDIFSTISLVDSHI